MGKPAQKRKTVRASLKQKANANAKARVQAVDVVCFPAGIILYY